MKEFTIGSNEAGQRFDKYLHKLLGAAPMSFVYRMLRKKNFTLNDRKASGQERLAQGDLVKLFLSDETFEKMTGTLPAGHVMEYPVCSRETLQDMGLFIVYEDTDILIFNKPAGMLSQKAKETDISVNEYLIGYLLWKGALPKEELQTFRPSVANRLDRNTSGLILCGKTLRALQYLSGVIRDRSLQKYYHCMVEGVLDSAFSLNGYLQKDEKKNRVHILPAAHTERADGAVPVCTGINPIGQYRWCGRAYSELEIHLITGKTHQIRAHLASIGHPLLGDAKYGSSGREPLAKECRLQAQLLHAQRIVFPKTDGDFAYLSEQTVEAPAPAVYQRVRKLLQESHE